jgi:hypothetical protein
VTFRVGRDRALKLNTEEEREMLKALLFGSALTLAAVSGAWFAPAAYADKTKDCGTTTATTTGGVTNPPNASAGFTQTTTTTTDTKQTSACNSNSDTGQVTTTTSTTGPTTNKGGGTPSGH